MAGVYNISSEYSFLDALAQGLLSETSICPLELSRYTLFLPTRKDCRELQKAFLRQSQGQSLLLPRMLPLGDLDQEEELILNAPLPDLPPVLPKFKRQGLLTKLILHYTQQHAGLVSPHSAASATQLAQTLMGLIDEAQVEGVDWEKLVDLVPTHLAAHWQITLDFLKIVSVHWPKILKSLGHVEPYIYNAMAVERLIKRWEDNPPQHPVIAAGSTGTRQSTSQLLSAISKLEKGFVLLPGFGYEAEAHAPTHPLHAHLQLLHKLEVDPASLQPWTPLDTLRSTGNSHRGKLFLKALEQEPDSLEESENLRALDGLELIEAATPQEEALTIALQIREALEISEKTVSLISTSSELFERVKAELKRWGVDCEGGSHSLKSTSQGALLLLILEVVHTQFNAHSLLALLKHPLVMDPHALLLELKVLRGPVLRPGLKPLIEEIPNIPELQTCITRLEKSLTPLIKLMGDENASLTELMPALLHAAELLVSDKDDLWKGPEGESLSLFFTDLMEAAGDFPSIKGEDFPEFMGTLLDGYLCVTPFQMHPRLSFSKPFEARLHHADLQILAGLNEGNWPKEMVPDAWMNHVMRRELGLATSEQKLGLSSHDFYMAFSAPEVVLTRSLRNQGAPTVPSRWLMRLDVSLKQAGLTLPLSDRLSSLSHSMDMPQSYVQPQRPQPCPPVFARPRQLSVTQIETWMRDPYALYAKHILRLKPLDDIAMAPSASDRGILFHKAFEEYISREVPQTYEQLLQMGERLFTPFKNHLDVSFFWWPRFQQVAKWFHQQQCLRPPHHSFTEIRGSLTFQTPSGPFTLTAQADRIDQRLQSDHLTLIDYKTGQPPTSRDIEQGLSPQLPLETAILMQGGFSGISGTPESMEFWWLKGGASGGTIQQIRKNPQDLAIEALEGLTNLVTYYDQPTTTYPAMPWSSRALVYNDYAHLARIQEWRNVA